MLSGAGRRWGGNAIRAADHTVRLLEHPKNVGPLCVFQRDRRGYLRGCPSLTDEVRPSVCLAQALGRELPNVL